jgi:hypothetical protein
MDIEVSRHDLRQVRVTDTPHKALDEGQARLALDAFGYRRQQHHLRRHG